MRAWHPPGPVTLYVTFTNAGVVNSYLRAVVRTPNSTNSIHLCFIRFTCPLAANGHHIYGCLMLRTPSVANCTGDALDDAAEALGAATKAAPHPRHELELFEISRPHSEQSTSAIK